MSRMNKMDDEELPHQGVLDPGLQHFGAGLSASFDRMVDIDGVQEATSLSRAQIYRLIKAETFPAGYVYRGMRRRVWRESEIEKWLGTVIERS